jgi:threonine dehydrogenase-like Zn-dependent dehydrogenase
MRTIAVIEPPKVEVIDIAEPTPGPYQVRVKTEAACLCNATDTKLVLGHFPGVDKYPLVLGHESVGIVDTVGEKVKNFQIGDRVIGGLVFDFAEPDYSTGWGGFCEYTLGTDHDAMIADGVADEEHGWFECYEIQRAVPKDISVEAAVLLCTWREVYGGFGDFNLQKGDDILVFGAGPVGLSFLTLGKLLGLGYIGIVDPLQNKRQKALAMGADAVFAPDSPELKQLTQTRGKPFDAIIDAVGNSDIINTALGMIKLGGSVCVYGVISDSTITLNKAAGPYNFNLYMHQWPTRHREHAAQKPLCEWIKEGKIKPEDFLTHDFKMEQINEALKAVKKGEVIKAILRY